MQEKLRTAGLDILLMTGIVLVVSAFQPAYAQDPSGYQHPSRATAVPFTRDAGVAYLEALTFCLNQIGSPITFDEPARQMILNEITRQFPTLPLADQLKLSTARTTWNQYQASWSYLSMEQKTAFAYDVFTLAFGAEAASQALGLSLAGRSGGSSAQSYDDAKDDFCTSPDVLAMGGCP